MKYWLLSENGNDYKANLHCHTVLSDGSLTPQEVKELYMSKGYSIIAYTDHDVFIPHPELNDDNFLALHGFEVEINEPHGGGFELAKTTHLCFIALDKNIINQPCWHRTQYQFANACQSKSQVKFDESKEDYIRVYSDEGINAFMKECKDCGFFATYNHPSWSLQDYTDWNGYSEMNALEIFNGACIQEGFDDDNHIVYDTLLRQGKRIFAIAGDDNHHRHDTGIAYTVIRSNELAYEPIAESLKNGNFYTSMGPEIKELYVEDGSVYVKCSPAQKIVFTTGIRHVKTVYPKEGETTVTEGSFELLHHDKYFRVSVMGPDGKMAYSNAYYPENYNITK
ncbi:MAG: PHP domain-containing protein [Oscillospiraceae bacterium]|nr:PHP domain-containing protein [Candidatus Equicaccousia limihippi]